MFEIGDKVVVRMGHDRFPQWEGLVGVLEEKMTWGGFRIRFPDEVASHAHSDPYILQLSTSRLRLCKSEIIWEV